MPEKQVTVKVTIDGKEETFTVYKFRFKDFGIAKDVFGKFLSMIGSYANLNETEITEKISEILPRSLDAITEIAEFIIPIGLRKLPDEIENIPVVDCLDIIVRIIEVNADFFTKFMTSQKVITEKLVATLQK